jgi:hypothetical protein
MIVEDHYTLLRSKVLQYTQGRGIHLDSYQARWIFVEEKIGFDGARDLPIENKHMHS